MNQETQQGCGEKERKIQESAVGWWWKTEGFVFKSSGASVSTSNTSTNDVSVTGEPAHQGERQDSEGEYEHDCEEEAPFEAVI